MERYSRQQDIIPRDRLIDYSISVIGVGAIGRQVAIQLTSIGAQKLQLVDFDVVEETNICTQGYLENDLGLPKVEATKQICKEINSGAKITARNSKFTNSTLIGDILFCCVDSMDARKLIWRRFNNSMASLFIDGRMSAEFLRVLSPIKFSENQKYYEGTLFSSEEAYQGSCTAKSTVYCASLAACLMVGQFTKFLRDIPLENEIQYNILTSEIDVF